MNYEQRKYSPGDKLSYCEQVETLMADGFDSTEAEEIAASMLEDSTDD